VQKHGNLRGQEKAADRRKEEDWEAYDEARDDYGKHQKGGKR